jgi:peptide methionine sulfoxide reductase msrA/msrB
MNKDELKKKLTPEQFAVTCNAETEPPFKNAYWNHHAPGIYVDVISGKPLFSSLDKYDSGSGWPAFTKPIDEQEVETKVDKTHGMIRTEVLSISGAHLGHIFDDGPKDKGGKRFCINSASLLFIPAADLAAKGYGKYASLFAGGISVDYEEALLGGGCFWGVEDLLKKHKGVLETEVGYAGGTTPTPVYTLVKTGTTGHAEVVSIKFNPKLLSYADLLDFFFTLHDPTTPNQQGNDKGSQYRSIIFAKNEAQKVEAKKALERASKSGLWKSPIVTEVVDWGAFYKAEDYHQDYLTKNPGGYTCHFIRKH